MCIFIILQFYTLLSLSKLWDNFPQIKNSFKECYGADIDHVQFSLKNKLSSTKLSAL